MDRLITNVALSGAMVFPTLLTALATPWKLVPLIGGDVPEGRLGLILSPGAFLGIGLTVVLLVSAAITTPETEASNTGAIGPSLALSVANAASSGEVAKTVSLIAPIYVVAILIGMLGQGLRTLVGPWWSIRTSLRAGFYQVGTTVCWIILTSAGIDSYRLALDDPEIGRLLYSINSVPIILITPWVYFWFFRSGAKKSVVVSLVLSVLMTAISAVVGVLASLAVGGG